MTDGASAATLEAAERVAKTLERLGIETALIGAVALAVHGYVRATQDVDLATSVDLWRDLRRAADELAREGFTVEMSERRPPTWSRSSTTSIRGGESRWWARKQSFRLAPWVDSESGSSTSRIWSR